MKEDTFSSLIAAMFLYNRDKNDLCSNVTWERETSFPAEEKVNKKYLNN